MTEFCSFEEPSFFYNPSTVFEVQSPSVVLLAVSRDQTRPVGFDLHANFVMASVAAIGWLDFRFLRSIHPGLDVPTVFTQMNGDLLCACDFTIRAAGMSDKGFADEGLQCDQY